MVTVKKATNQNCPVPSVTRSDAIYALPETAANMNKGKKKDIERERKGGKGRTARYPTNEVTAEHDERMSLNSKYVLVLTKNQTPSTDSLSYCNRCFCVEIIKIIISSANFV